MGQIGVHSYVCNECGDDTGLSSPDGINGHVTVTKVSLQVGELAVT